MAGSDPMIIFVDPTNTYMNWWPIVEEQRQHAPTLLVPMPWKNLTTSRVFSDTFWNKYIQKRDRKMNQRRKQKRGTNVYKVWNQKFIFMREAARANPFDTEFFYWIDAGYIRNSAHSLRCTPLVRNNITESSAVDPRTQLVYHMIHEYPKHGEARPKLFNYIIITIGEPSGTLCFTVIRNVLGMSNACRYGCVEASQSCVSSIAAGFGLKWVLHGFARKNTTFQRKVE